MKERGFAMRRSARMAAFSVAVAFAAAGCSGVKLPLKLPHMPWSKPAPAPSVAPLEAALASYEASAPAPVSNNQYGTPVDSVVANVDGSPITSYDVKTFNAAQAGGVGGVALAGAPSLNNPDDVLKALITQQLLDNETEHYADKVDDEEVDRYIQTLEQKNHITDDQLRAQLQAQGMSYGQFRKMMRKQVEEMAMIDREVRQKIHIPDSEVLAYYKNHPDEFTVTDEKYRLAQILIAVPQNATPDQIMAARRKADDIRNQIAKGKDFGDLARHYSDDDSKTKGGELGYFSPNDLNDEIAAAVKNVKPGGVTQVVHTKYGFHIIKVEEHQTPGVKPFEEVEREIRDKLMTEQAKGEFQKWIDQDLARQHYVETNE